jgi:hypothetical protein
MAAAFFRSGAWSVPAGVAEVTLTGLDLPFTPASVIVGLRQPNGDADIIAAIGVHPSTFYRWLKDGEEAKTGVKRALYDELKKAESQYKRCLLTTIKSAAESRAQYWTAAAWLLERKYPMEYGKMERKADDGDNAPVQLVLDFTIEPVADDDEDGGGGNG